MVFRLEKGENVLSPFFLSMLMYYASKKVGEDLEKSIKLL